MTTGALVSPSPRELADRVHAMLVAMDPALWRDDACARSRELLAQARAQAAVTLEGWRGADDAATADQRLRGAVEALYEALPEPGTLGQSRSDWAAVYQRVWPLYEVMASELKAAGARVKHVHPHNWARTILHVGTALVVAFLFELVLTRTQAIGIVGAWVVWAWALEYGRKRWEAVNDACMTVFGPFSREHERHRVNSATWLGSALLLLALTTPQVPAVLGLLTIGIGDPVAALIGRRWGRTKLFKGRSLEGSSAFFGSAFLLGFGWLLALHGELGLVASALLAATAALVGAIVELLSTRLDDNLMVPLLAAWATALVAWLVV